MGLSDLDVHLQSPDATEFRGRCLDIEPTGGQMLATVEFDAAHAPLLRLGAKTELEFRAKGPDFSVTADALTVLRSDDAARRCYCFRGSLSKKVFLHLLGRRRAHRTRVPALNALRVSVLDLGVEPPDALLHDVSAMGLSIVLRPEFEDHIFSRSELRLAVRLPGEAQVIEIVGAIRHRRLLGSSVLYGLEIEGQIPEFMRAQDKLALYVAGLREQVTG